MSSGDPIEPTSILGDSRRRALIALAGVMLLAWGVRHFAGGVTIDDPQPPESLLSHKLADRIDPNTADVDELSAIPQIGPKRASDIVAYRARRQSRDASRPAFVQPTDLLAVPGIGPAVLQHMRPFLLFPPDASGVVE